MSQIANYYFPVGNDVIKAKTGSAITAKDSVNFPLLAMNVYGKSTQDGTPSPTNPVPIVSVGDDGELSVTSCGKNLLQFSNLASTTANGVSIINNSDGTFTVSGSKTDKTKLVGVNSMLSHEESILMFKAGAYCLSGVPADYNSDVTSLYAFVNLYYNGTLHGDVATTEAPSKQKFTITQKMLTDDFQIQYGIFSKAGFEVVNATVMPQIELGSTATDYEPYTGSTAAITSALPLCGLPVESGGNYTDSNGQQWVCDELIYRLNGTGKVLKRTVGFTFDGSEDEGWALPANGTATRMQTFYGRDVIASAINSNLTVPLLCNRTIAVTASETWIGTKEGFSVDTTPALGLCIFALKGNTDLSAWTSYLAENPYTVVFLRATPEEIELTAEEMAQLKQLYSYNSVTNVFNDEGAGMSVKYCTSAEVEEYILPLINGGESNE